MKQKLLLTIVALLCAVGSWAQTWTSSAVGAGTFYLYNVGADKFLCSGDSWGSRACVTEGGIPVTLAGSGTSYSISTAAIYSGKYLNKNNDSYPFMDISTSADWVFESTAETNVYRLKLGDKYLYWDGVSTITLSLAESPDETNSKWMLVTEANRIADLSNATNSSAMNATFLIKNAYFAKGVDMIVTKNAVLTSSPSWKGTSLTDLAGYDTWTSEACYAAEQYGKTFDNYQELSSIPNGKYQMTAKGFYRGDEVPYIYANSVKCDLKEKGTLKKHDGTVNDGIESGAIALRGDDYLLDGVTVVVTDGNLRVGVKSDKNIDWAVFDDFSMQYYGNAVEVYSPEAFTSPNSAIADKWYAFTVTNAGMYKITSSKAATISYTQDESDDADDDVVSKKIENDNEFFYKGLSAGTFYFKTDAEGTITIEKVYDDGDDVTSRYITNPSFEDKDVSCWTFSNAENAEHREAGGSRESSWHGTFWRADGKAASTDVYQSVTLPAGFYRLEVDAFNNDANSNKWSKIQLYFGTKNQELDYKTPKGQYQTYSFEFEVEAETTGNLGAKFTSEGTGMIWEYFDSFVLTYLYSTTPSTEKQDLLDAITTANGIYNNGANVGTGVFQIPADAATTFTAAIATARGVYNNASATAEAVTTAVTTLETAQATYQAAHNAPTPGQAYIVANTTANGALKVATERVTVDANAAVFFTAVSGGYVISNADDEYIYKTTGNNWTLSTTADKGEAYVITSVNPVDGGFTIQGAKGLFGTDATAAGSTVYANKAQANNGVWTITEATTVNMNVKAGKWGTFIAPFDVTIPANVTAYNATGVNGERITLSDAIETTIPANTPVLLKNDGDAVDNTLYGVSTANADSYTVGLLTGVYTAATIPAGASNYVLQTHDDGVQAFYKVDADFTATPYKCYLTIPAATSPVKAFLFPENPTAINAIETAENENTEIYNLAGQRMSKVQKGVNIINGKKVLVK